MNTRLLLRRIAGLTLIALLAAVPATAFEGKIDMKMTTDSKKDGEMLMSYRVKDKLLRVELAPAPTESKKKKKAEPMPAMIIDTAKNEMLMIMDSEQMYMVQKLPDTNTAAGKKGEMPDFKPTGRKEKIAGYEAEEYVGKSDGKLTEIWVTKELGKFIMAQQGGGRGQKKMSGWEAFAQKENFFPLRTIVRAKEGAPEEMRMEVIKIDRSKQDASLFAPPAGYTKFEMPSMPGMGDMMKGMIPGR